MSQQPQGSARALPLTLNGNRERKEDEFVTCYREMLAVMRRVHDLGGDPQIKGIIDRAQAALGRVPR